MTDIAAVAPRVFPTPSHDIVVIGASAGGVQVLLQLVARLPADFPAALLVVLHVGAHRSLLPDLMSARGLLPARHPQQGERIRPGQLYVAPPDLHMLVGEGAIHLQRGPKENHARPAIDPLFRTAALAYGRRVIGVILSGRLDDGTAGLQAIKRCGGLAVIQDPTDAEQPDMPASALAHVDVDHSVPAAQLGDLLMRLVQQPLTAPGPEAPAIFAREQAICIGAGNPMEHLNAIGEPSRFACPECSGVLWQLKQTHPTRFRCHTGHAYTLRSLAFTQDENADEALWSAMRALQEREALLRAMAASGESDGDGRQGESLLVQARRSHEHAQQLRDMIQAE